MRELVLSDAHLRPYARALLDARVAQVANAAYDAVFRTQGASAGGVEHVEFVRVEGEARVLLEQSLVDGSWTAQCKGRELLKAYCGRLGLNYEHFRNLLISRLDRPPASLQAIMAAVMAA